MRKLYKNWKNLRKCFPIVGLTPQLSPLMPQLSPLMPRFSLLMLWLSPVMLRFRPEMPILRGLTWVDFFLFSSRLSPNPSTKSPLYFFRYESSHDRIAHDNSQYALTSMAIRCGWVRAYDGRADSMCAHAYVYRNNAITLIQDADQLEPPNVCIGSSTALRTAQHGMLNKALVWVDT
jgi:hypothetical protein